MARHDQRRAEFRTLKGDSRRVDPAPAGSRRSELAVETTRTQRKRRSNRIVTGILVGVLVVAGGFLGYRLLSDRSAPIGAMPAEAGVTVRDESHRLSTPAASKATFVEFLDFECEACRAAFPVVEQLRKDYGDQVTFVARYFPLEAHFNSQRAARAVEAAAQQGQFEQMYIKMYETQTQWGEQQVPQDALFRTFAVDLGLDMARFDDAYASEATWDRIQRDLDDGNALGLRGTPSFFLDGEQIEPKSVEDLRSAIERAIAE